MATACELIKHIKNIRTGQGHFPDISCMKSILMYVLWESRYVISNILEQEKPWNWRSLKYLPRPNANFLLIFGLGLTRAGKNWLDSAVLVQEMNFYNVTCYNIYSRPFHTSPDLPGDLTTSSCGQISWNLFWPYIIPPDLPS